MGRRGPAPTPSAVLKLRGTYRQGQDFNEPRPPPAPPDPPDWLDEPAREVWAQLAPQLKASGLLTILDVHTLARYCQTWVRWRSVEEFIARHGSVYPIKDEKGRTRCLQQFPQVSIANKLSVQLTRMEAEFGMTPSARGRIHVDPSRIPGEPEEEAMRNSPFFADRWRTGRV